MRTPRRLHIGLPVPRLCPCMPQATSTSNFAEATMILQYNNKKIILLKVLHFDANLCMLSSGIQNGYLKFLDRQCFINFTSTLFQTI
jgi:hypothetical protein